MDPPPSQILPHRGWILVYASGNALSLAVFLMLYQITAVLADFRDPMLYALLCSIALRTLKDWIVGKARTALDQDKPMLLSIFSLFMFPVTVLWDIGIDVYGLFKRWKQAADELKEKYAKEATKRRDSSNATTSTHQSPVSSSKHTSTSPQRPSISSIATPGPFQLYLTAGKHTLMANRDKKRRRKGRGGTAGNKPRARAGDLLLVWLFRMCIAWAVFEWIRDSWSPTLQILVVTGVALAGCITLLVMLWTSSLTSSSSLPPTSPEKSQTKTPGTPRSPLASSARKVLSWGHHPFSGGSNAGNNTSNNARQQQTQQLTLLDLYPFTLAHQAIERTSFPFNPLKSLLFTCDTKFRALIRSNLHAIVTLLLVMGLLVGTTATTAFLSAKVIQEGRAVVLAARGVFPAPWVASGYSISDDNNNTTVSTSSLSRPALPNWVETYRHDAMVLIQRSLPSVASWLESQFQGYLESHNLTHALGDIRWLYESVQGQRKCSDKERQALLVALAKAEVAALENEKVAVKESEGLKVAQEKLKSALEALEQQESASFLIPQDTVRAEESDTNNKNAASAAQPSENKQHQETPELAWLAVVEADIDLKQAETRNQEAIANLEAAQKSKRIAASRLQLCTTTTTTTSSSITGQTPHATKHQRGVVNEIGDGLNSAYRKIWRRQLQEGVVEFSSALTTGWNWLMHKDAATASDLPVLLQRLIQVAAVPLTAVGKTLAGSLGSTTAVAVMGSMGLLRLGLGVLNLGLQFALFVALLYYLLAAERDPLARAAAHLPLSESGRARAAMAINKALGGVFMSMLKLAALHALLTWLSYSMLDLPLVYTSSIASAAFSLLPFIPTYAVTLPAVAVLAAQGRTMSAVLLPAIHFAAYYIGDGLVLEQAGNPMVVSLSILGGLWAFSNPLLGCFLGPILVSLLSAVGTLLADLLASDKNAWATPVFPTTRGVMASPAGKTTNGNVGSVQSMQRTQSLPARQLHLPTPASVVNNNEEESEHGGPPEEEVTFSLGGTGGGNSDGESVSSLSFTPHITAGKLHHE